MAAVATKAATGAEIKAEAAQIVATVKETKEEVATGKEGKNHPEIRKDVVVGPVNTTMEISHNTRALWHLWSSQKTVGNQARTLRHLSLLKSR